MIFPAYEMAECILSERVSNPCIAMLFHDIGRRACRATKICICPEPKTQKQRGSRLPSFGMPAVLSSKNIAKISIKHCPRILHSSARSDLKPRTGALVEENEFSSSRSGQIFEAGLLKRFCVALAQMKSTFLLADRRSTDSPFEAACPVSICAAMNCRPYHH